MFRSKLTSLLQTAMKSSQTQINRSSLYQPAISPSCQNIRCKSLFCDNSVKYRCYSFSSEQSDDQTETSVNATATTKVKAGFSKYKVFSDNESPVILDVDEERMLRLEKPELFEIEEEKPDEFAGLNLESKVFLRRSLSLLIVEGGTTFIGLFVHRRYERCI